MSSPKRARVSASDVPMSKAKMEKVLREAGDIGDASEVSARGLDLSSSQGVLRLVKGLEGRAKKNQELRLRHGGDPEKWLKSEVDLEEDISRFSEIHISLFHLLLLDLHLSEEPLPIDEFFKSPASAQYELPSKCGIRVLCGLLTHSNSDICSSVLSSLSDVAEELQIFAAPSSERSDEDNLLALKISRDFVRVLFGRGSALQLGDLLTSSLKRLSEDAEKGDESALKGITDALKVIEYFSDLWPSLVVPHFFSSELVEWLVASIRGKTGATFKKEEEVEGDVDEEEEEDGTEVEVEVLVSFLTLESLFLRTNLSLATNRAYAAEILSILLQHSSDRELEEGGGEEGGEKKWMKVGEVASVRMLDRLLRVIAAYRVSEPSDSLEAEFVENVFDILCLLVRVPSLRQAMSSAKVQGIALLAKILHERRGVARAGLRLASHALRKDQGNCDSFVERLGLRSVFSLLMRKNVLSRKLKEQREDEGYVLEILHNLLGYCSGDGLSRVLHKFTESRFEKLERLLELHCDFRDSWMRSRTRKREGVEGEEEEEEEEEEGEEGRRVSSSILLLRKVDLILSKLGTVGNKMMRREIFAMLQERGVEGGEVGEVVREVAEEMEEEDPERESLLIQCKVLEKAEKA